MLDLKLAGVAGSLPSLKSAWLLHLFSAARLPCFGVVLIVSLGRGLKLSAFKATAIKERGESSIVNWLETTSVETTEVGETEESSILKPTTLVLTRPYDASLSNISARLN